MTRREWLQKNPRPKSAVHLNALLDEQKERRNWDRENATAIDKRIKELTAEIAVCAKCPTHQLPLHYHRNRPEDLFLCENGPHFLFWTMLAGKPALVPVTTLMLPGLDWSMTEGFAISHEERKALYPSTEAK